MNENFDKMDEYEAILVIMEQDRNVLFPHFVKDDVDNVILPNKAKEKLICKTVCTLFFAEICS